MTYNFDIKINTDNFEIQIDTKDCYGYFEHNELGDNCGGGLWFENVEGRLHLTDYDGVFDLPSEVSTALVRNGVHVGPEFF